MSGSPAISARDLSGGYGGAPVISGLDFDVAPGAMVAVLGPTAAARRRSFGRCSASCHGAPAPSRWPGRRPTSRKPSATGSTSRSAPSTSR